MDSVVTGAAIGLAGAIIGALGGYLGSVRTSNKTIEHDREKRVWERRAEAYLAALAAVEYLQVTRGTADDWDPPMLKDFLRTHDTPDWEMLQARMQAFASEPVRNSMHAVSKAYKELPALDPQAPLSESSNPRIGLARVASALLIKTIRTELQRSDQQLSRSQRRSLRDRNQISQYELEALEAWVEQPRSG